jgi:hypothetical protein
MVRACLAHVLACVPSVSFILSSLSELALLDLLFSLAAAIVDLVPNGPSLSVPDHMSYSAVSLCP